MTGQSAHDLALSGLLSEDAHDRALLAQLRPPDWVNPTPPARYNLVVVGGGTAGLVAAAGAAGLGARVALVERWLMGGDCLNYGCVPSKALLRAARAVHEAARGAEFGVRTDAEPRADFAEAMNRLRRLRAALAPHDSPQRFADLGVDVYLGTARFVSRDHVDVDGRRLRFSRAVVATGSRAAVPPIEGLASAGYLTNETIFALTAAPSRLLVVGAGPVGCELAQAFARFGSKVTVLSRGARMLPRAEADAADVLARQFAAEGISVLLSTTVRRVDRTASGRLVVYEREGREGRAEADEILVAAGRLPNLEGLDLHTAGVAVDAQGVAVDDRLRTTNRRIFGAGDVCSREKFTHAADAMARIAIQNALFFGRKRMSRLVIPWCTYTDPEVAHVGLDEAAARAAGVDVRTVDVRLSVDRAILDGDRQGFARLHVERRRGRILGATIVARHAGEMIGEVSLAITAGLRAGALSSTIHPYPTQAEVIRMLGDAYRRSQLTPRLARVLRRYFAWRR
jgi:pyruvate/2-oxoglutarate dehydrogenase complex dihydrolipoamide dehydrogenase (E3) component